MDDARRRFRARKRGAFRAPGVAVAVTACILSSAAFPDPKNPALGPPVVQPGNGLQNINKPSGAGPSIPAAPNGAPGLSQPAAANAATAAVIVPAQPAAAAPAGGLAIVTPQNAAPSVPNAAPGPPSGFAVPATPASAPGSMSVTPSINPISPATPSAAASGAGAGGGAVFTAPVGAPSAPVTPGGTSPPSNANAGIAPPTSGGPASSGPPTGPLPTVSSAVGASSNSAAAAAGSASPTLITTPKGEILLSAGKSVELVDPGTPNLRVQVTAPDHHALDLGRIITDSGRAGIFAGLASRSAAPRATAATKTADGRVLLKSAEKTLPDNASPNASPGKQDRGADPQPKKIGLTRTAGLGADETLPGKGRNKADEARDAPDAGLHLGIGRRERTSAEDPAAGMDLVEGSGFGGESSQAPASQGEAAPPVPPLPGADPGGAMGLLEREDGVIVASSFSRNKQVCD